MYIMVKLIFWDTRPTYPSAIKSVFQSITGPCNVLFAETHRIEAGPDLTPIASDFMVVIKHYTQ